MSQPRVLVVDDEVGVRELLGDALRMGGYQVVEAADGLAAIRELERQAVDLVVADVNMPKLDGFGLVEKLRGQHNQTPVLLLTARGDRTDVARGLRAGADDYLTKPFGLEELMLRVAAILRRTMPAAPLEDVIKRGDFEINRDVHTALYKGVELELSPTEFNLLAYLLERAGKVVSKTDLLADVWGMSFTSNTGVVDTYVSYLRKKLAAHGFENLQTVRGVGVRLLVEA